MLDEAFQVRRELDHGWPESNSQPASPILAVERNNRCWYPPGAPTAIGLNYVSVAWALAGLGGPAWVCWVPGGSIAHAGAWSQPSSKINSLSGRRRTGP